MQSKTDRAAQIEAIHDTPAFLPYKRAIDLLHRRYGDRLHVQVSDYSNRIQVALDLGDGRYLGPVSLRDRDTGYFQLVSRMAVVFRIFGPA